MNPEQPVDGKLSAIDGQDIPINKLKPLRERKISKRDSARIAASLKAMGLLQPFLVFPEGDHFVILDGYVRYCILLREGVETIPCIVWKEKDAFTPDRMVSRLSPTQEIRMIKQSLGDLDEKTIAEALAVSKVSYRLNSALLKQLSPRVASAYDAEKITKSCAWQLTFVEPERQEEILELMQNYNDFSIPFAQTMILKTPAGQRVRKPTGTMTPWDRSEQKKSNLLKRLKDAEDKHDFYSNLYRQYSINLLKLVIYVRALVTNERVAVHLQRGHADLFAMFQEIISHAEG